VNRLNKLATSQGAGQLIFAVDMNLIGANLMACVNSQRLVFLSTRQRKNGASEDAPLIELNHCLV
jgi:hypothetical protein